jgi:hypothetical protein
MTAPRNRIIETMTLSSGQKKSLIVHEGGLIRIGILVREIESMKRSVQKSSSPDAVAYITQNASGKHIGTYYSASTTFDLSLGKEFTVENRSSVASDIAVYSDPNR